MPRKSSMEIQVGLDIQQVETSLIKLHQDFMKFKGNTESLNSDFIRMDNVVKVLGTSMTILGAAGVGAMVEMAKRSPETAASMADIRLSMFELSQMIGADLAPKFQQFASGLSAFTIKMASDPPLRKLIEDAAILVGAAGLGGVLTKLLGIQGLGEIIIPITYLITRKEVKEDLEDKFGDTGGKAASAGLDVGMGILAGLGVGKLLGLGVSGAAMAVGGTAGMIIAGNEMTNDMWNMNLFDMGTTFWMPKDQKTTEKLLRIMRDQRHSGIVGETY